MFEMLGSIGSLLLIICAFSVLIFVHELGHFLAAVIVGVKPERFFIGFDIYGLGLKKEYKGCVYGIGLLPLGGYVKLAGQSDDPRAQREGKGKPDELYSKPLWAQAFVLVAGVAMNMVFGFLLLFFGYTFGMPYIPSVAGNIEENSPAYLAGIKSGDKILKIDGKRIAGFNKLSEYVALNGGKFIDLTIERDGKTIQKRVMGQARSAAAGLPMLGVQVPLTAEIGQVDTTAPYYKFYKKYLADGEVIVEINGREIANPETDGYILSEELSKNPAKNLKVVVSNPADGGKRRSIELPVLGNGTYDFGYSLAINVAQVMDGYPASKAGLRSDDKIVAVIIDGKRHDLLSKSHLISLISSRAYLPVKVSFLREGKEETVTIAPRFMGGNVEVPAGRDNLLGVITSEGGGKKVTKILPGGPAVGILKTGDEITKINDQPVRDLSPQVAKACCGEVKLKLAGIKEPVVVSPKISLNTGVPLAGMLLDVLRNIKVYQVKPDTPAAKFLTVGDIVTQVIISPDGMYTSVFWHDAETAKNDSIKFKTPDNIRTALAGGTLGEITGYLPVMRTATHFFYNESPSAAASLAFAKSIDLSKSVYKLLHRLLSRDISTKAMTGPIGIIRFMDQTLEQEYPFWKMLSLLALISINLAVFNLLPFPVLDGGHLVFIIVEAIKGSPPSDRLRELTQYFGVFCLLGLMVYVSFNDVVRYITDKQTQSMLVHTEEAKERQ